MSKPHMILIHGMGTHEKDTFIATVTKPLDSASENFSSIDKISESVELSFISYNEIFESIRAKIAEASIDDLATKFPGAPSLVSKLNNMNSKFNDDSFFYTHLLDVILYRSYYADAVQARVGKHLVDAMKAATNAAEDCHILCHSLGTAVMHDTLHKLYTNSLNDEHGEPLLSPGLNKIRSITMVANVSQLPITEANPYTSVVKPGPDGICDYFTTCRHVLDPIASFSKFNQGSNWPLVTDNVYRNIAINKVERANVHDLDHYLADPKIYLPLFMQLFPLKFKTNSAELKNAYDAHAITTVQGRFEKLKDTLEDADITLHWDNDENDFVFSDDALSLHEQLVAFRDHLKTIQDQINNLQGDSEDD